MGRHRFLAKASPIFGRNHMDVRPISVEGGFVMISRHEGLDLGAPSHATLGALRNAGTRDPPTPRRGPVYGDDGRRPIDETSRAKAGPEAGLGHVDTARGNCCSVAGGP